MMKGEKHCSFCGKTSSQTQLVYGREGSICLSCAEACRELLQKIQKESQEPDSQELRSASESSFNFKTDSIPTPKQMKTYLDQYVIGQDEAKKTLSVAVYNHYKRLKYKFMNSGDSQFRIDNGDIDEDDEYYGENKKSISPASAVLEGKDGAKEVVELDKSNILLIGPTGSGKTLLARTLARKLNVPFTIADATTLTEAGYVGEDVENILLKLIQNADGDIKKAETGIIFIDEIDKIAKKGENMSITRDVSGEGVQQSLLKIIEGTVASVPPQGGRKHPNQEMLKIDTSNILFICGGAFVGLEKIIDKRTSDTSMGFGAKIKTEANEMDLETLYKEILPDDLIKFGLIPEFIGRVPIVVGLGNLSKEQLSQILVEPKNSIVKQYMASFKLDGVDLDFNKEAISAIADKAIEQKTGARGLRSIVEGMLIDVMYELPDHPEVKNIVVNKEAVKTGKVKIA